jgi:hypothetical protein
MYNPPLSCSSPSKYSTMTMTVSQINAHECPDPGIYDELLELQRERKMKNEN